MSALPPEETRTMLAGDPGLAQARDVVTARWAQLHDQAAQLCALADLAVREGDVDHAAFAVLLDKAPQWQSNLAADALADIDAMMQPGLTALRTITARGADASAPALALWREFHCAREAVLTMLATTPTDEVLDAA